MKSVCLWPLLWLWAPSRFSHKSWINCTSWASQDLPLRKPCWNSTSISWSDKCCIILLTRMCSKVQHIQVRETVICQVVLPYFLIYGSHIGLKDWLKMQARTWAISALHSFNTRALRSSEPEALLGLRWSRSFLTMLASIDISSISGYGLGPFKRMSPAFSQVYTDPNCLLNMSALSLLPVFKIP